MVQFSSRNVQKPDPLLLGGPNLDPYPSICVFCRVWLDPSVPIPGFGYRVFLLMVAFIYPTSNRKMLTLVYCCPFLTYWPPLYSETRETHSLTHPENESQWRVNDFWSSILGNLSGDWIQTFINVVKAAFKPKRECDTLPAAFWKWASTERQQCLA